MKNQLIDHDTQLGIEQAGEKYNQFIADLNGLAMKGYLMKPIISTLDVQGESFAVVLNGFNIFNMQDEFICVYKDGEFYDSDI